MTRDTEPQLDPGPARRRSRWTIPVLSVIAMAAIVVGVIAANLRTAEPEVAVPTLSDLGAAGAPTGEPAADFTVDLLDGTVFDLGRHLAGDGRPVFLNLWASWCVPCRNEMPAIEAASQRWPGVYFLGIAVEDDPVAAEEFATEIGVTYSLAIDESDTVTVAFPYFGLPATFVIATDGTIARQLFGEVDGSQIDALLAGVIG